MTRISEDELRQFEATLKELSPMQLQQVLASANTLRAARKANRSPTREDIVREHEALGVPVPDVTFELLLGKVAS